FVLGGVFAYVVAEERKFLNFEKSTEINIISNPSVDPAMVVDIKDFKGGAAGVPVVAEVEKESYAMAVRQKPVLLNTGGFLVHLLVQNPTGSKYAKIEETIPSGYLFESVDPHEGIESFSSSTVKFIWMKLPQESEFEVTYRLVPKRDEPQGEMIIEGLLTYSAGNENKLVEVKEVDVALESMSLAEKRALLLTGEIPSGAKKSTETAQKQAKAEPKVAKTEQQPIARQQSTGTSGRIIVNTRVLAAGGGVYFRVQLAANRNAFDARTHFRKAGVDKEVFVEEHNGLHKYTVGPFTAYKQAAAYRNKIEKLSRVSGSFVVAYKDGRRIPVSSTQ
ncbi:MAG: SPOR domain-containing protein, partial [Bacteroidales bacterium]|nr:SPOR domain-containing protein [Bacteroidales bacterium]